MVIYLSGPGMWLYGVKLLCLDGLYMSGEYGDRIRCRSLVAGVYVYMQNYVTIISIIRVRH